MIKLQINEKIYQSLKISRASDEEIEMFPAMDLHPSLGKDYKLKVYCNNSFVNLNRFTKYLKRLDSSNTEHFEEIWSLYHQLSSQKKFNISIQNEIDVYNLLYGIISMFNEEDIRFFIEEWTQHTRIYPSIDLQERFNKYEKWWNDLTNNKQGCFWIASPKTRKKIEKLYKENSLCVYD